MIRRRIGTACIAFGTALVLAALSLFIWNQLENSRAGNAVDEILPAVIEETNSPCSYSEDMTEVEIDGYYYIGYVTVPSLSLELPVMTDWSYPQLKISPCRYSGSVKTDNLVIAAHNYISHFGKIKDMSVGDTVIFTDMNGVVYMYEVAEINSLSPSASEEMTDSGYALTLFTCTYGGQSRVTVRCDRVK